tara:strand:+ start:165 stop:473 length:309 start_codon:yes stop_codon:yes gene_type:complete
MPVYPVINHKTGEKKEMNLTIDNYLKWRKENPDWDKNWHGGIARVGKYPRRALISDAVAEDTRAMDIVKELEAPGTEARLYAKDLDRGSDVKTSIDPKFDKH